MTVLFNMSVRLMLQLAHNATIKERVCWRCSFCQYSSSSKSQAPPGEQEAYESEARIILDHPRFKAETLEQALKSKGRIHRPRAHLFRKIPIPTGGEGPQISFHSVLPNQNRKVHSPNQHHRSHEKYLGEFEGEVGGKAPGLEKDENGVLMFSPDSLAWQPIYHAQFDKVLKKSLKNLTLEFRHPTNRFADPKKKTTTRDLRSRQSPPADIASHRRSVLAHPAGSISRSYYTSANITSWSERDVRNSAKRQLSGMSNLAGESYVREHLETWQKNQNINGSGPEVPANDSFNLGGPQNLITQSAVDDTLQFDDQDDNYLESTPQVSLRSEEQLDDISSGSFFFAKGDLVGIRTGGEPTLAVFVQVVGSEPLFYTIRGRWEFMDTKDNKKIQFTLPRFFSPSELDPIIPYLPKEQFSVNNTRNPGGVDVTAPRKIGGKIIEKLLRFHQETDEIVRTHADGLNNVFDIMAHPTKFSNASLHDIALKIFQIQHRSDLTPAMLWTVHRVLSKTEGFSMKSDEDKESPSFFMISKQDAEDSSKVRQWMREYQEENIANVTKAPGMKGSSADEAQGSNPFPAFISKTRNLIESNRKIRDIATCGAIGSDSSQPKTERLNMYNGANFSVEERQIIRFLFKWCTTNFIVGWSSMASLGPMILRAIGMYDNFKLDEAMGYVLLQELGCISPWDNRVVFRPGLPLPGHGIHSAFDRLRSQVHSTESSWLMKDSMRGFRKDWKDLAVFCIDPANTEVIDDGLSLEEIEGDPSAFWVHIHTANPSAFLNPVSKISQFAQEMVSTVYFAEKNYPLLPTTITKTEFSLKRDRPCITFSAKMTTEGNVIQREITHGVLRNIKYVTPEILYRELGFEKIHSIQQTKLTVGGDMSVPCPKNSPQALEPSDIKKLRKLCEISVERRLGRERRGVRGPILRVPKVDVNVFFPENVHKHAYFRLSRPIRFSGDPVLSLTNTHPITYQWTSPLLIDQMISDFMILGGEIAASWCRERNIPIVFRGTFCNNETKASAELYKREILDPVYAKFGNVSVGINARYGALVGRSTSSASPLEHLQLGVSEYCKATSPLRRFPDLLAHWQIEAAIRHESETGVSLIGNTNDNYLPFSRASVEAMVPQFREREYEIISGQNAAKYHWQTLWMFRAFHLKEAPLPETFEVMVVASPRVMGRPLGTGCLADLGLTCDILENEATAREGKLDSEDVWEARISEVDMHRRRIRMDPIRLISRGDPMLSDANIFRIGA